MAQASAPPIVRAISWSLRSDIRSETRPRSPTAVARHGRVGRSMKIRTSYWAKPIPIRAFDWSAVDDATYDGAGDSHCPIGYGATERDAIDDLKRQIDEMAT
jgi:hypothetical protein